MQPSREHGYLAEGPRILPDGRLLWITIQAGAEGDLATRGAVHIADLSKGEIKKPIIGMIPKELAVEHRIVPLLKKNGTLIVATEP